MAARTAVPRPALGAAGVDEHDGTVSRVGGDAVGGIDHEPQQRPRVLTLRFAVAVVPAAAGHGVGHRSPVPMPVSQADAGF